MPHEPKLSRRQFTASTLAGAAMTPQVLAHQQKNATDTNEKFQLNYLLGSCLYGYESLESILPEVRKCGATAIDLWPKVHGNQREQLDELGEDVFRELMLKHRTQLGCITQYPLGPFGLQDEMKLAQRLGCSTIVTGGKGPRGLSGSKLKSAVREFAEKMKPHLAIAEECGVTIAIENHGNNLIESPDSMKWLIEFEPSKHLAIALAPYHLPQEETPLAELIRQLGSRIQVFYAWQHGMGCMKKLPKDQELLQMPGRGSLDFGPLLNALVDIKYSGWTEIFMHPVPRGIPILDSVDAVTAEINSSRNYLNQKLSIDPTANRP